MSIISLYLIVEEASSFSKLACQTGFDAATFQYLVIVLHDSFDISHFLVVQNTSRRNWEHSTRRNLLQV